MTTYRCAQGHEMDRPPEPGDQIEPCGCIHKEESHWYWPKLIGGPWAGRTYIIEPKTPRALVCEGPAEIRHYYVAHEIPLGENLIVTVYAHEDLDPPQVAAKVYFDMLEAIGAGPR